MTEIILPMAVLRSEQPCPVCGCRLWIAMKEGPEGLEEHPIRADLCKDGQDWALIDLCDPGEWLWDCCLGCDTVIQ